MRNDGTLNRRAVAATLLRNPGEMLVVTGLGAPTYDAAAAGDRALNFYLWGAMGGAAMLGLGLALAQPSRRVLVLTGDGEMLMGMGSLATIAAAAAANLAIAVLDNARYGETGSQRSHTGLTTDLAAVAAGVRVDRHCHGARHGRGRGAHAPASARGAVRGDPHFGRGGGAPPAAEGWRSSSRSISACARRPLRLIRANCIGLYRLLDPIGRAMILTLVNARRFADNARLGKT